MSLVILLCVACVPLGMVLLTLAFDRPEQGSCGRCRYSMRGLPSRCCPECGHLNPALEDAWLRLRHTIVYGLGVILLGACAVFLVAVVAGLAYGKYMGRW